MYARITLLISCILILYSQVIEVEASVEKDYIHIVNQKSLSDQEIRSSIEDEAVKVTDSSFNMNKSKVLKYKDIDAVNESQAQAQSQQDDETDLSGIITDSDALIDQIKSESINNKDSIYYLSFGYVALILCLIYFLWIKQ